MHRDSLSASKRYWEGDAVGSGSRTHSQKLLVPPLGHSHFTILGLLLWKFYTHGMKHGKGVRFFYARTLGHCMSYLKPRNI